MLKLPLEDYILTFDDGLYSQYLYFDHFKKLKTEKYYFISTNIVCPEDLTQSTECPDCRTAHAMFFQNNEVRHYMKWSQIREIYQTENCFIGGHSHSHRFFDTSSIRSLHRDLTEDTEIMLREFEKQNIKVKSFCYPYNKQYNLYETILKNHGIELIFGKDRIAIEDLK